MRDFRPPSMALEAASRAPQTATVPAGLSASASSGRDSRKPRRRVSAPSSPSQAFASLAAIAFTASACSSASSSTSSSANAPPNGDGAASPGFTRAFHCARNSRPKAASTRGTRSRAWARTSR